MAKSGKYSQTRPAGLWTLWLDIDGTDPQNKVSLHLNNYGSPHYVADLNSIGSNQWEGGFTFKNAAANGFTINGQVPDKIRVNWGQDTVSQFVNMYLFKGTTQVLAFGLRRASDYFRAVELEYDYESGVDANAAQSVTVGGTTHTLTTALQKAGIEVTVNGSGNAVASAAAGGDAAWTNAELQDAMQSHWSRTNGTPWALWVFFCKKETNPGILGRMFDSSDAHQRNGTAIFVDAHVGIARADEYLFQTVIHEVGHAFNLAHSWLKSSDPWCGGIVNEPQALSYMNYPWKYTEARYGHQIYTMFFDEFQYRFSDQELAFLRHAPDSLVSMGQQAFHSDHGATIADAQLGDEAGRGSRQLALTVRVNKPSPTYEFLEPVQIELELENVSADPVSVPTRALEDHCRMALWIRRNDGPAVRHAPFDTPCFVPESVELAPGESMYGSLFLSAGSKGWQISEPGRYGISVALDLGEGGQLSSNELTIAVYAPSSAVKAEAERVAQDYFTDGVARSLAYGGSKTLTRASDALRDIAARFPQVAAAKHAALTTAMPGTRDYKLLDVADDGSKSVKTERARPEAIADAKRVLVDDRDAAAETLGNMRFAKLSEQLADGMAAAGDGAAAAAVQQNVLDTMKRRGVTLPAKVSKAIQARVAKLKRGG